MLNTSTSAGVGDDQGWAESITLSATNSATLAPISSVTGGSFVKVTDVASPASGTAHNDYTVGGFTAGSEYATTTIGVLCGDNKSLTVTSISTTASAYNADLWSALRVAISADGTNWFYFRPSANNTTSLPKAISDTSSYAPATNKITFGELYAGSNTKGVEFATPTVQAYDAGMFNLTANSPQAITIRWWIEGNDQNATNKIINVSVSDIQITFGTANAI